MRSLGLLLLFLSVASATPIIAGLLSGVAKGYGGRRSYYAAARVNGRTGGILGTKYGGSYAANGQESKASKYQAAQKYASEQSAGSDVSYQNAATAQNYASNSDFANAQVVTNSRSQQSSETRKEESKETKEESSVAISIGEAQLKQKAASQQASAESGSTATTATAKNAQKATKSQKRSGRKAKVTSTQSIRILIPGQNQAGKAAAASGNYARTSKTMGQSVSKHKSEENTSSVMSQVGSRTDTASVTDKRHVGVDANQQAHFNTDSTGMQEIVLTQSSVAQKKKSRTETTSSAESTAATHGAALAYATSSKKSTSSKASSFQASEAIEESSSAHQSALGQQTASISP